MNKQEILIEAVKLTTGDRNEAHGDPTENHTRIAKIWSVILEKEVSAYQVALCMAGLKLARAAYKPIDDSFIDMAAYAAIAGEIVNGRTS